MTTPSNSQDVAQPVDPQDWDALADIALRRARAGGAEYGDIRILTTTTQTVSGHDGRLAGVDDRLERGFGVRVLYRGAWGFAASSHMTAAEVRAATDLALEIAQSSAALVVDPVKLAPEPVHKGIVTTPHEVDPFEISLADKSALVLAIMDRLHGQPGIARSQAELWAQRDLKLFASTEGTHLSFDLLACRGAGGATAVHEGQFASRNFGTPYLRTGYEQITNIDLIADAERAAVEALEHVRAPLVEPGQYDLILDPQNLALTIHETCGHPTELDRVLGYEANLAGTSFLTPEKLGNFRYGSKHVNLVADNTEPGTLAATGFDDDGVECQRWPIVHEGIFVGYSTSREMAPKIGQQRSRGSNRADSWASVPIVRIPNLGLEPGAASLDELLADVQRGIYIEGRGSFSIDQRRYNFQFGGDAFWLIEHGRRTHMLRDVVYHGITPEFWARCDGVANRSHRQRYGFVDCGKGQPMQSGWMTHATAPARFRDVSVIRGATTA
ncbi:MAG: TldD/PmbA family protein [Planctomycetes bacterium]|nr:TldD/PmbA family protein [Planctomycetota bacterium]